MDPAKRASALAHYLEGVGLRATERLVGVSHNAVMNWVLAAVAPGEVEWVEADELWTYVGQKKRPAGSGGLLIVLPRKSVDGRWVIVAPKRPAACGLLTFVHGRFEFRPPPPRCPSNRVRPKPFKPLDGSQRLARCFHSSARTKKS